MRGHKQEKIVIHSFSSELVADLCRSNSFCVPTGATEQVGTCDVEGSWQKALLCIIIILQTSATWVSFIPPCSQLPPAPVEPWMHDQKIQVTLTCSVNLSCDVA